MFDIEDASYAVETEPPALRHWLRQPRAQVQHGYGGHGNKTELTYHDIAVLAIVRELVNYRMDVESAWRFAHHAVTHLAGWSEDQPRESYWLAWKQHVLVLRRKDGEWVLSDYSDNKGMGFTSGLSIYPAPLIQTAIERAEKSAARRMKQRA